MWSAPDILEVGGSRVVKSSNAVLLVLPLEVHLSAKLIVPARSMSELMSGRLDGSIEVVVEVLQSSRDNARSSSRSSGYEDLTSLEIFGDGRGDGRERSLATLDEVGRRSGETEGVGLSR